MRQTLVEIKRLRVARSALKGKMVDLIHRLAEREEETLRSELRATIRAERAAGPHNRAGAAPEPDTTCPSIQARPATTEKFETPKNRAEVRAFSHFEKMLSDSNPGQAFGLQRMHKLPRRGASRNWNEERDKELRPDRTRPTTNQPKHTAHSTSHTTVGIELRDTDSDTHSDMSPSPAPTGDRG